MHAIPFFRLDYIISLQLYSHCPSSYILLCFHSLLITYHRHTFLDFLNFPSSYCASYPVKLCDPAHPSQHSIFWTSNLFSCAFFADNVYVLYSSGGLTIVLCLFPLIFTFVQHNALFQLFHPLCTLWLTFSSNYHHPSTSIQDS